MFRRISRYSGMSFNELVDVPYSYFLLLNKESWIDSYMQFEDGRELLKTLWRLKQTEPDLEAVHKYQNRGDK